MANDTNETAPEAGEQANESHRQSGSDIADWRMISKHVWNTQANLLHGVRKAAAHSRQGRYIVRGALLMDVSDPSAPLRGLYVIAEGTELKWQPDDPGAHGSVFPTVLDGELIDVTREDGPWWALAREHVGLMIAEISAKLQAKEIATQAARDEQKAERNRRLEVARKAVLS